MKQILMLIIFIVAVLYAGYNIIHYDKKIRDSPNNTVAGCGNKNPTKVVYDEVGYVAFYDFDHDGHVDCVIDMSGKAYELSNGYLLVQTVEQATKLNILELERRRAELNRKDVDWCNTKPPRNEGFVVMVGEVPALSYCGTLVNLENRYLSRDKGEGKDYQTEFKNLLSK